MPSSDVYTTADISTAELQSLIDSADSGTTIHLEAGTYTLTQTLVIDRSDISLVGAGSEETIIVVAEGLADDAAIQLGHDTFEPDIIDTHDLAQSASAGETEITLESGHGLSVGDFIYITQENTDEFFEEIGDEDWQRDSSLRTVLVEITEVNGNTVAFDTELPFDFDPDITTVEERNIIEDNTLSGFTIVGSWGEADPSKFSNVMKTDIGATLISVAGTSNAVLTDIAALDSASHGITVGNSTNLDMSDIIIDGAHDKGDGGNGYGIWVRDVYDSSFTDLSITDTRHAVVFASYTSASGNTIEVINTNRDINFHGGLDQNNTVTVESSTRTGDETEYMSPTVFFNEGTHYGAPTDRSANDVTFSTVVGTVRAEEVTAADTGSTMSMNAGADIVHTGAGDDVVDLGTGADIVYASGGEDTLIGGSGRDTVVFELSEASYSTAWDGDTLVVSNGGNVTRLSRFETVIFGNLEREFASIQPHVAIPANSSEIEEPAEEDAQDVEEEITPPEPEVEETVEEPEPIIDEVVEDEETEHEESEPEEEEAADEPEPATEDADTGVDDSDTDVVEEAEPEVEDTEEIAEPVTEEIVEETDTDADESDTDDADDESPYDIVEGGDGWERATVTASSVMGEILDGVLVTGEEDAEIVGNIWDNSILGNTANNTISGDDGEDRIFGRAGDDVITGDNGDDFLHGQSGDDIIDGGAGVNTLVGGSGADIFVGSSGTSTVIDFDSTEGDSIQVEGQIAFSSSNGDLTITYGDEGSLVLLDTTFADLYL